MARTGRGEMFKRFCWRNFREKDRLEDPVVDGRTILNCYFKEKDGGCGLDRSESGQGQMPGYCEIDNELPGYKKKLAASSMLHEAKIAYYAFDVIVYCMYTHQTRIAYTKRTH